MTEGPWLDEEQQRLWRSWLAVSSGLPTLLNRELQQKTGLSLPDFDVLVQLSEAQDSRMRVTTLAQALGWEKSRTSHHLTRMARRGLIQRAECADDGRGAFVELTQDGRQAIESAAPDHARHVRDLFFTDLTVDEFDVMQRALSKLQGRVRPPAA
ncbi:MarR family transcriptional regulator [Nocardioides aestuarii]|uniref:MarR family winged helix-turn-helix transcriptional regulator n=1 Tax=Nocardioides aestuarii TaxID=252231 RepID=A0ABW4TMS0_9ACTN